MLRTFASVMAGAGIFASVPLTNAWACDDDRYPCPIRSEALIQETVQAPDQLSTDQPQKSWLSHKRNPSSRHALMKRRPCKARSRGAENPRSREGEQTGSAAAGARRRVAKGDRSCFRCGRLSACG